MDTKNIIEKTFKAGVINNKKYTLKPIECPIKLNQNESPYDLPEEIKDKIIGKLKTSRWNIYPDFTPEDIYKKVASYYGVTGKNILIGNGSNEMINTILTATLESGKKIIIPQPTFTVYKLIASNLNANIKEIFLKDDLTFDINKIIEESKTPGSVTIICTPNNPTGTFVKYDDLEKIIKSSGGIVVVDEAYIQFGGESVLSLINKYPNLIILRTFSKVFGLAGLRIGIMISNEEIITELSKVKLPYNLNVFSLITLDTVFDNIKIIDENLNLILKEKFILENELKSFNDIKVIPSATNFFLVNVKDSKWFFEKLLESGILVRDVSSYPMLKNCLRISVGNKKENEALINALRKIYK